MNYPQQRNNLIIATFRFAVSLFYKDFKDPIELSYFLSASDQFIPVNTDKAQVYGAEFEIRRNLGFIGGDSWEDLSFNLNFSVIQSELKMSEAEYERRLLSARDGETISDTREMQGQSPFLVNAGIDYDIRGMEKPSDHAPIWANFDL